MNIMNQDVKVILVIKSDCPICSDMKKELIDNPIDCDILIHKQNIKKDSIVEIYNITVFPTVLLINANTEEEIGRYEGFIDYETLNDFINYAAEHLV